MSGWDGSIVIHRVRLPMHKSSVISRRLEPVDGLFEFARSLIATEIAQVIINVTTSEGLWARYVSQLHVGGKLGWRMARASGLGPHPRFVAPLLKRQHSRAGGDIDTLHSFPRRRTAWQELPRAALIVNPNQTLLWGRGSSRAGQMMAPARLLWRTLSDRSLPNLRRRRFVNLACQSVRPRSVVTESQ